VTLRVRAVLVGLGLAAATGTARAQGGALDNVRIGVAVRPETVTVGDPLLLSVRVQAPQGATIEFPAGPDSGGALEATASRRLAPRDLPGVVEQTATYPLVAWDVGDLAPGLSDVVVRLGGAERRIPLGDVTVHVRSVLPADTTLHVPKPPRPPIEVAPPWWQRWWPFILAAVLAALLAWWLWRRRRRRGAATPEDALVFAEREFARVEALGLVEAGERGRHVALMVDVLRDYLARRVPEARASLTSSELIAALRSSRLVPHARLAAVLEEADLVKFARRPLSAERARELGRDARGVVRDVERAASEQVAVTQRKAAA
jgi:hypothetical protein